eukprot:SAG31_NODE_1201_length_9418_cov_3.410881_1_plen_89_part_10
MEDGTPPVLGQIGSSGNEADADVTDAAATGWPQATWGCRCCSSRGSICGRLGDELLLGRELERSIMTTHLSFASVAAERHLPASLRLLV